MCCKARAKLSKPEASFASFSSPYPLCTPPLRDPWGNAPQISVLLDAKRRQRGPCGVSPNKPSATARPAEELTRQAGLLIMGGQPPSPSPASPRPLRLHPPTPGHDDFPAHPTGMQCGGWGPRPGPWAHRAANQCSGSTMSVFPHTCVGSSLLFAHPPTHPHPHPTPTQT